MAHQMQKFWKNKNFDKVLNGEFGKLTHRFQNKYLTHKLCMPTNGPRGCEIFRRSQFRKSSEFLHTRGWNHLYSSKEQRKYFYELPIAPKGFRKLNF